MKKITILLVSMACLAMGFTSCQKEESATSTFTATFEPLGGKCFIGPIINGNDTTFDQYWEIDEHLVISNTSGVTGLFFIDDMNNGNPIFKWLNIPGVPYNRNPTISGGPYYALTPALSTLMEEVAIHQSATSSTGQSIRTYLPPIFTIPWLPMASYSNDNHLIFKHVCGLLQVYITLPEDYHVYEVYVTSNRHLYGYCDINFDANGDPLCTIDSVYQDSIYAATHGSWDPDEYYTCAPYYDIAPNIIPIPLLPNRYDNLELAFRIEDDYNNACIVTKRLNPGSVLTIERAKIHNLKMTITETDIANAD